MALFSFSLLRVDDPAPTLDYLMRFLLYDIAALLVGMQSFDRKKTIIGALMVGALGLPLFLLHNYASLNTSEQMGVAYSCLPIILVSIVAFRLGGIITALSAVDFLCIIIKIVGFAPRGIWVVILAACSLVAYQMICGGKSVLRNRLRAIALLSVAAIIILLIINNFAELIIVFSDFLDRVFHIRIYALEKMAFYINKGDFTNGRKDLYNSVIEFIIDHPIFGCGIGYVEAKTGTYAHNIFLQALCEGGLFVLFPVMVYVVSAIGRTLAFPVENGPKNGLWEILAVCCGIIMFFFSSVYWIYVPFWFFLGTFLDKPNTLANSV